jgi:hypothetical protein
VILEYRKLWIFSFVWKSLDTVLQSIHILPTLISIIPSVLQWCLFSIYRTVYFPLNSYGYCMWLFKLYWRVDVKTISLILVTFRNIPMYWYLQGQKKYSMFNNKCWSLSIWTFFNFQIRAKIFYSEWKYFLELR